MPTTHYHITNRTSGAERRAMEPKQERTKMAISPIRVAERRLPALLARWSDLAKRAARLHLPAPELVEVGRGADRRENERGVVTLHPWVEVEARGTAPTFGGWRLLATLQHVEGLVILRGVPGEEIPARYRTADPADCDHCHARRRRINTYVIAHEDGRTVQLGGDCAQHYLPSADVTAILAYMVELLGAVEALGAGDEDDFGNSGGHAAARWELAGVLAATLAVVRVEGWVSRTTARSTGGAATADAVSSYLDPPRGYGKAVEDWKRWAAKIDAAQLDTDAATAAAAIEWALAQEDTSDYGHNIAVVATIGWVEQRTLGIACSIVTSYQRAMGREVERRQRAAESHHVGTVGKREVFAPLQVTSVRYFESDYGSRACITFRDDAGNVLLWWTGGEGCDEMEKSAGNGKRWSVKGTVKSHSDYRGVKQTVLSRCAVTPVAAAQ